jgi:(R,R)-butanediol dehydrogenase/meso-butanediol dehydrogenase/diacetyl reductase
VKGLLFPGDKTVVIEEFDDPVPGPLDVVIEMRASGICGTDLHQWRAPSVDGHSGYMPSLVIPGHEPCGVVVARGSALDPAVAPLGQRVMVHHYWGCGTCDDCRTGWPQLCPFGSQVFGHSAHGGHADYLRVPAMTLIPLPEELSFEEGAAISCGTGTAWGGLRCLDLTARDVVVIFGQGAVGLSATMFARAMGADVIAVDLSPARLALATQIGATSTINASESDAVEAVKDLTGGKGATAVLECTGAASVAEQAVRSARMWGRVCFVGMSGDTTLNISRDVICKQLTMRGSWSFSSVLQRECTDFIARRGLPLSELITDRFELAGAADVYRALERQEQGKATFVF